MSLRSVAARRAGAAIAGVAALTISLTFASPADARRKSRAPAYAPATASIVVDAKTGQTLQSSNADAIRYPASITKVMTLYLLFEQLEGGRIGLDTHFRISAHAAAQPPSKLGLQPGDKISVDNAIKALVTKSANDIAAAVAENLANTEEAFAEMMTRKARALGMSRTVYVNASGLPDERQVTTARDLAILARAIQDRFPRYYQYFSTPSFTYGRAAMRNHNKLLGRVEGVDGIKTGYTRMSGFNLMTSAKVDGRHVVAIVLGGRSGGARDRTMTALLGQYLPRAYAGRRTAPMVAEASAAQPRLAVLPPERPSAPAIDVPRPRVLADAGNTEESEGSAPAAASVPRPSNVRPVVASASDSMSTTTPSAFRWIAGALARATQPTAAEQPMPAAHAPERKPVEARALDPKPFQDRAAAETAVVRPEAVVAKVEPRPQPRPEPRPEPKTDPRPTGSTGSTGPAGWVIQLGAPEDERKAKELLAQAKAQSRVLAHAAPFTEKTVKDGATLWRARFSGFDSDEAQAACKALKRDGFNCFATKG